MSKKRRQFTDEFKAEVVALCRAGDRSLSQVAHDLGLPKSAVHQWLELAKAPGSPPPLPVAPLAQAEREELARLRKENARLKMEREILKKAAAFFAQENA